MTRIRKSPEERKGEIIEAADRLFSTKGYTNTAVSDICKEVGVAKSTFFYHFKTKEDVMEVIMHRYADEFATLFSEKCLGLAAVEQLQLFINSFGAELPVENMLDKMEKSSEFIFFDKLWESIFCSTLNPLLRKVFAAGIKDGTFSFKEEEISERLRFLWSLMDYLWYVPDRQISDDVSDMEMDIRINIASYQLEALMGMESGILKIQF